MPIRDATAADLDQICALIEEHARYEGNDQLELDRAGMREYLFGSAPVAWAVIAETSARVAGFALCTWSFSTWEARPGIWLDDLYIRPDFRSHGFGRAMLAELGSRTSGRVEWEVRAGNERAEAFYQRLGAEPVHGWVQYRWRP